MSIGNCFVWGWVLWLLVSSLESVVLLIRLPQTHDVLSVCEVIARNFAQLPAPVRRTLTWDQGPKMASHALLAKIFDQGVYFAEPGSPWQRGTNENTNGLLRQYFPKRSNLHIHTASDLEQVEKRLNNRPRKTLNWNTPSELFNQGMTQSNSQLLL